MATRKKTSPEAALETLKRKAGEQLAIDRHKLLMKMPFIGSLLMRLELVPVRDDRLQTAATNGDSVFVDIDFYAGLTAEERLFVLAHVAWHCALLHFARRQDRAPDIFNCAADLEIHFILTREGLKAPFVLPHDPAWNGLSAEEIYARYPKDPASAASSMSAAGHESANIRGIRSDGGFDTHLDKDEKLSPAEGTKGEDGDFSPKISAGAVERCRERLTAAVQQYQRMKGDLPLGVSAVIEKVLEPKIHWREVLAQFVTGCYGGSRQWLPPNRRHVWHGLYIQSSRDTRLDAVVAVDTSGSAQGNMPRFFGELGGLLGSFGSYRLTVIQCDAEIQQIETFDDMTPFPPDYKWRAKGGGGTDFRPVFDYAEKELEQPPDLLIYLTDGYGAYPERAPAFPVLWVTTPDSDISVSWGSRCPLEEDGK